MKNCMKREIDDCESYEALSKICNYYRKFANTEHKKSVTKRKRTGEKR